ncbi:hypothetical protein [Mycolicibacterium neoaurum]|uniref:hypothetical protein n=1 Tax=Mycolicibacterium neoaurum TaxID=1795 RepID=UPI001F4228CD|nr:hypothetical protein [Mycolicibacterium neoaurum]
MSRGRCPASGWVDARLVAGTVSFDVCAATDPVGSLRQRAATVRAGRGADCVNPAGVAQALDIAATVLDVL